MEDTINEDTPENPYKIVNECHRHWDDTMEKTPAGTTFKATQPGVSASRRRSDARLGVSRLAFLEPIGPGRENLSNSELSNMQGMSNTKQKQNKKRSREFLSVQASSRPCMALSRAGAARNHRRERRGRLHLALDRSEGGRYWRFVRRGTPEGVRCSSGFFVGGAVSTFRNAVLRPGIGSGLSLLRRSCRTNREMRFLPLRGRLAHLPASGKHEQQDSRVEARKSLRRPAGRRTGHFESAPSRSSHGRSRAESRAIRGERFDKPGESRHDIENRSR